MFFFTDIIQIKKKAEAGLIPKINHFTNLQLKVCLDLQLIRVFCPIQKHF